VERQRGYRNVAVELSALVAVMQQHWSAIQGRTGVTTEELSTASLLAQQLFRNGASRDARHPHQVEASLLRNQAFTVLTGSYEQMRRCIAFLEPEDAEQLAPSLYQGRGGGSRKTEQPSEATPPVAVTDPVVTPPAVTRAVTPANSASVRAAE
jgi:hypothetical protein